MAVGCVGGAQAVAANQPHAWQKKNPRNVCWLCWCDTEKTLRDRFSGCINNEVYTRECTWGHVVLQGGGECVLHVLRSVIGLPPKVFWSERGCVSTAVILVGKAEAMLVVSICC